MDIFSFLRLWLDGLLGQPSKSKWIFQLLLFSINYFFLTRVYHHISVPWLLAHKGTRRKASTFVSNIFLYFLLIYLLLLCTWCCYILVLLHFSAATSMLLLLVIWFVCFGWLTSIIYWLAMAAGWLLGVGCWWLCLYHLFWWIHSTFQYFMIMHDEVTNFPNLKTQ